MLHVKKKKDMVVEWPMWVVHDLPVRRSTRILAGHTDNLGVADGAQVHTTKGYVAPLSSASGEPVDAGYCVADLNRPSVSVLRHNAQYAG